EGDDVEEGRELQRDEVVELEVDHRLEEVGLVALLRRRPGREGLARNARGVLLARPGRLRRLVRRALVLRCLRLGVRLLVPGALLRLLCTEAVPIGRMRHGAVPVPSVLGDIRW